MEEVFKFKHGLYSFVLSLELLHKHKDNIRKAISSQFEAFETSNEEAQLFFYFVNNVNEFFNDQNYLNINNIKYTGNSFLFADNEVKYVFKKESNTFKIFVEFNSNITLKDELRFLKSNYLNVFEIFISKFYYRVFLVFSQYMNIMYDSTYIHAASIANDKGEIFLFPADSGVGKSSMLLSISQKKQYHYVADDLSIVDRRGNVYFVGRNISIKPYHVKNYPFLKEVLNNNMPFGQKLQWQLLKEKKSLSYRLNYKEIFNERMNFSGKIKTVVHLINSSKRVFHLNDANSYELSRVSSNILMNELYLGYYNIYKVLSIPNNCLLESPVEIYNNSKSILIDFFNCALNRFILEIPNKIHPEEILNFLEDNQYL